MFAIWRKLMVSGDFLGNCMKKLWKIIQKRVLPPVRSGNLFGSTWKYSIIQKNYKKYTKVHKITKKYLEVHEYMKVHEST